MGVYKKRPNTRGGLVDYETTSNAGSAYIGKHSNKKDRTMSAQSRTMKLTSNAKTFYPEQYFKRVGYQQSDAGSRVDALGQRVRDRFNEELAMEEPQKKSGGLHHRTLKQLQSNKLRMTQQSATGGSRRSNGDIWSASRHSLVQTSFKNQNDMRYSTIERDVQDKDSVITRDVLKKFNEIQGASAARGDELVEGADVQLGDNGEDFERADEVYDLEQVGDAAEEEKDEVRSL